MFASNDPEAHIKLIDYGEASKFTKEKLSKKSGTVCDPSDPNIIIYVLK